MKPERILQERGNGNVGVKWMFTIYWDKGRIYMVDIRILQKWNRKNSRESRILWLDKRKIHKTRANDVVIAAKGISNRLL